MKNLTVKQAKNYIVSNYGQPRHNISSLVKACKIIAKQSKLKPLDLFFLLIENKPIEGEYTHSYGFHTRTGRELIESLQSAYYQVDRGLKV